MTYYPDQRFISKQMTVRRQVMLPEEALGTVRVHDGKRVDIREVVAQGLITSRHIILEGAQFFGLKKPDSLSGMMFVNEGDTVDDKQPLAGKSKDRGKRLFSPVKGIVAQIANGRIILQEMPQLIDLQAGVQGKVVEVNPGHGIIIETIGAIVQGVWGNNRNTIATLRMEPEEGIETIVSDQLENKYGGAIVVTRRQLKETGLTVMADQGFAGVIAPSMDADLREQALEAEGIIFLTEGFGAMRLNNIVQSILTELDGRVVTLDAFTPTRWDTRRPELIVNMKTDQQRPPSVNVMLSLRPDLLVRVTRAPYLGIMGKVVDLPKTASLLDNGLRVLCAKVELVTGETAMVPLADLEYFGR